MQAQKQKRIFEVTVGQIGISLLIAAIALTAVFEAGVLVGKKRGIKAALEAEQQSDKQTRSPMKVSTEANLPGRESAEQLEPGEDRQSDTQPYAAEEVSTEPELSQNPLSDESTEALPEKASQYTVQVGAFSSLQNAESLINLLKSYEYESWLKPRSVEDKTLYFVFVGRFEAREEADKFGRLLQNGSSHITAYKVSKWIPETEFSQP
jgi:cell division septation protein DedD